MLSSEKCVCSYRYFKMVAEINAGVLEPIRNVHCWKPHPKRFFVSPCSGGSWLTPWSPRPNAAPSAFQLKLLHHRNSEKAKAHCLSLPPPVSLTILPSKASESAHITLVESHLGIWLDHRLYNNWFKNENKLDFRVALKYICLLPTIPIVQSIIWWHCDPISAPALQLVCHMFYQKWQMWYLLFVSHGGLDLRTVEKKQHLTLFIC